MENNSPSIRTGLSYAAWGYLFVHVDINIGSISILPSFVGNILLYLAIQHLGAVRRDLLLLKPLCIVMGIWNAINWATGATLPSAFAFVRILLYAISLYFNYQFFTDMAALAADLQPPEAHLDRTMLHFRTVYLLLSTVWDLLQFESQAQAQRWMWPLLGGAVIWLLAAIALMVSLFSLRRYAPAEGTAQQELPPKQ